MNTKKKKQATTITTLKNNLYICLYIQYIHTHINRTEIFHNKNYETFKRYT